MSQTRTKITNNKPTRNEAALARAVVNSALYRVGFYDECHHCSGTDFVQGFEHKPDCPCLLAQEILKGDI